MLPGPVFNYELLITARRARYYVLRAVYGLILLFLIWQNYESWFRWSFGNPRVLPINQMAQFALSVFTTLMITQGLGLLLIIPVLFAGAIADEKQRKTLHYLLASRLSSAEIVLGKLMARFLHVAVFLALVLPIVSLLTLLGGVPPDLLVATYLGTLSSAFFLAALSLLVSTYAQRVRDAVILVYLLILIWLLGPVTIQALFFGFLEWVDWKIDPTLQAFIDVAFEWIHTTNPFYLLAGGLARGGAPAGFFESLAWMIGLQVSAGLCFVGIAVARLRPVFQKQATGPRRGAVSSRFLGRRRRSRSECGDDPMLWKEAHVAPSTARRLIAMCTALGFLVLAYFALDLGWDALKEMLWDEGYFPAQGRGMARDQFNIFTRVAGAMIYVVWALGLAVAAASAITSEREEDTWISLLTTTLTPREILNAKALGALWRMRFVGASLLGLWIMAVLLGALSPLGATFAFIEVALFSWFALVLGLRFSLSARNTLRATAWTVLVLIICNGGYLMCCIPIFTNDNLAGMGCTPFLVGVVPVSYIEVAWFLGLESPTRYGELIATCLIGTFSYGIAALLLTLSLINDFDRVADRPRRLGRLPLPPARMLEKEGVVYMD